MLGRILYGFIISGNIINGIIFYTNYLILVPKFFFKSPETQILFIGILLLTFCILFLTDQMNLFLNMYREGDNTEEINKQNPGIE